jgi:hypothetical protein
VAGLASGAELVEDAVVDAALGVDEADEVERVVGIVPVHHLS